jgi:hypothetical protein
MRAISPTPIALARKAADNRSCVICTPAIHGGRVPTALLLRPVQSLAQRTSDPVTTSVAADATVRFDRPSPATKRLRKLHHYGFCL